MNWNNIYTTNYDTLLEQGNFLLRKNQSRTKTIDIQASNESNNNIKNDPVNIDDKSAATVLKAEDLFLRNQKSIIKLHGSLTYKAQYEEINEKNIDTSVFEFDNQKDLKYITILILKSMSHFINL